MDYHPQKGGKFGSRVCLQNILPGLLCWSIILTGLDLIGFLMLKMPFVVYPPPQFVYPSLDSNASFLNGVSQPRHFFCWESLVPPFQKIPFSIVSFVRTRLPELINLGKPQFQVSILACLGVDMVGQLVHLFPRIFLEVKLFPIFDFPKTMDMDHAFALKGSKLNV